MEKSESAAISIKDVRVLSIFDIGCSLLKHIMNYVIINYLRIM